MLALKNVGISLLLAFTVLSSTLGMNIIKMEAEYVAVGRAYIDRVFMRSAASGEKTVLVKRGKTLRAAICLDSEETFLINKIVYSTDGFPVQVDINIDEDVIGQFTTHTGSNWGHLWNEFHKSGSVGLTTLLAPGRHDIIVSIAQPEVLEDTEQHGVEIDYIELAFSDSTNLDQLLCEGQTEGDKEIVINN